MIIRCNNGITIPILEDDPCNGSCILTKCVYSDNPIISLGIPSNTSLENIINNIAININSLYNLNKVDKFVAGECVTITSNGLTSTELILYYNDVDSNITVTEVNFPLLELKITNGGFKTNKTIPSIMNAKDIVIVDNNTIRFNSTSDKKYFKIEILK